MRILLYICLFIPVLSFSQHQWKLNKNKEGIKIWTRAIKDTPYKEYKAVTHAKTSLKSVTHELLNAPLYMKNCKEGVSHLVKVNQDGHYFFYVKNKFQWPVKDRDVVSKLRVQNISDATI